MAMMARYELKLRWRFLFGFAPSGVFPANFVTKVAVRSYRTFSPLPALKGGRFVFCGTVPRVTPAGRYPALLSPGARTFLALSIT